MDHSPAVSETASTENATGSFVDAPIEYELQDVTEFAAVLAY